MIDDEDFRKPALEEIKKAGSEVEEILSVASDMSLAKDDPVWLLLHSVNAVKNASETAKSISESAVSEQKAAILDAFTGGFEKITGDYEKKMTAVIDDFVSESQDVTRRLERIVRMSKRSSGVSKVNLIALSLLTAASVGGGWALGSKSMTLVQNKAVLENSENFLTVQKKFEALSVSDRKKVNAILK